MNYHKITDKTIKTTYFFNLVEILDHGQLYFLFHSLFLE